MAENNDHKKKSGLEKGGHLNTTSLKLALTTKVVNSGVIKLPLFLQLK